MFVGWNGRMPKTDKPPWKSTNVFCMRKIRPHTSNICPKYHSHAYFIHITEILNLFPNCNPKGWKYVRVYPSHIYLCIKALTFIMTCANLCCCAPLAIPLGVQVPPVEYRYHICTILSTPEKIKIKFWNIKQTKNSSLDDKNLISDYYYMLQVFHDHYKKISQSKLSPHPFNICWYHRQKVCLASQAHHARQHHCS